MPQERNRVTLASDTDQYGLPIPRVTHSWCDNDKRVNRHALRFMRTALSQSFSASAHFRSERAMTTPR